MKLLRKFEPTTGASNTRLRKNFSKWEINDVKRNPLECITEIELLKGDPQKIDVQIDD